MLKYVKVAYAGALFLSLDVCQEHCSLDHPCQFNAYKRCPVSPGMAKTISASFFLPGENVCVDLKSEPNDSHPTDTDASCHDLIW